MTYLFLLLGFSSLYAQPSASTGLNCITELELPQFAVAHLVPDGGNVNAFIRVKNGRPDTIRLDATDPHLSAEVEYHLREKARYDGHCNGEEIHLEFTFKVEGDPVARPFARVRFQPPNRFVITTQPSLSTPDMMPVERPAPKRSPKK